MKIKYRSNNSGGDWWLKDESWHALEAAGWEVIWRKERWLGSLASVASKDFETPAEAMKEFEKITGADVADAGCSYCGAPHNFYWGRAVDDSLPAEAEYGYASGEGCLKYLFPHKEVKKSLRDYLEGK